MTSEEEKFWNDIFLPWLSWQGSIQESSMEKEWMKKVWKDIVKRMPSEELERWLRRRQSSGRTDASNKYAIKTLKTELAKRA